MGTTSLVSIKDELRHAYLDYAMSVIIGRALPDVRDGLKPVHRRVLFAMHELGNAHNKPYKKSARIVGDVIGKYHPHGDAAVYDTLVRMAQDFSMRHVLVDGQGNFGSIDGDPPAAMRYTEVRLARIAEEMLADLDKRTVDFLPNYDGSLDEPAVLPTSYPNLLVNGSAGIAVGMATNIPTHNLGETIDATIHLIRNPEASTADLLALMPGPDFPTGGLIYGVSGLRQAYETGHGVIKVRGVAGVERHKTGREAIVITEIPYQVNKAAMIERIAELVNEKVLSGVSDVRDESDRHGLRVVVEVCRDANAEIVLNQLYKHTALQSSFGINMLAIVHGQPRVLSLRELLRNFVEHRREVVRRRSQFELDKARLRFGVVAALLLAIDYIERVIELIRASTDAAAARVALMAEPFALTPRFAELLRRASDAAVPFGADLREGAELHLSEPQAQAILDLRLHRLTGLEREKLEAEARELTEAMLHLLAILRSEQLLFDVIVEELEELKARYAEPRRTRIEAETRELSVEDLIPDAEMLVTISHAGYIKRCSPALYRAQRRGGRGLTGMTTREEDFVERLFVASTHDYVLVFTRGGRCYWLKVYGVPEGNRQARGKALVNLIKLEPDDAVAAVLPVRDFVEERFVVMASEHGVIKKTTLMAFSNPRASGIVATGLEEGDHIIGVALSDGKSEILLSTSQGISIRFPESDVRPMGRTAAGVRGITLEAGDRVIAMEVVTDPTRDLLCVSMRGYGKRTPLEEFRQQHRGGHGMIAMKVTERNGALAGMLSVSPKDEVMLITDTGMTIRTRVKEIARIGRNTQGVRVINVESGSQVVAVALLAEDEADAKEGAAPVPGVAASQEPVDGPPAV